MAGTVEASRRYDMGGVSARSAASPPAYAVAVAGFTTWIDRCFARVPVPYPLAALGAGLALWLAGLAATASYGFAGTYLRTIAIYPWALAVVWIAGVVRWATLRTRRMLLELRTVFVESDAAYGAVVNRLDRRCRSGRIAVAVAAVSLLALWAVAADMWDGSWYPVPLSVYPSMRHLPAAWYAAHRLPNLLVLATYAVACTALLVSALWYLGASMWFLLDIRRFRTIPIPGVILTKCRDIANFYLIAFYSATVGVGLYVVLAKDSLDRATVAVAVGLALVCALPSVLPQLVFYRFLRDANLAQAAVAERLYRAAFLARGDPGPGAGPARTDLDAAEELAL
jgi:hypothetical protein